MTHPEREPRGVRGRPQRAATSGRYRGRRQARRADIGIEQLEPRLAMAVLPVLTDPAQLTAVGSTLYFSAGDATGGQELWKADGTESGTARVKDIVPGVGGSKPTHLVAAGTSLAFQFDGRTDGRGLWITDGTDAGTKSISDPWVKPTGYFLYRPVGRPIYLQYLNTLDPDPRPVGSGVSFTEYDSQAGKFFLSQASAGGDVTRVREVPAPPYASFSSSVWFEPYRVLQAGVRTLAASHTTLYYEFDQGLWRTDAPGQGSTLVASLAALDVERIIDATSVGSTMFFTAAPKAAAGRGSGTELWLTDGTAAGTHRVRTAAPGTVTRLTAVGSTLILLVNDAAGPWLWRTDGTDAGTIAIKGVQPGATSEFAAVGDTLYFTATDAATGPEIWRIRGDSDTTELVADVRPGATGSAPASLTALGSTLYFTADDGARGREIWKTDGTSPGTALVADLAPAAAGSSPASLTAAGPALFFTAKNAAGGIELWKTDGTPGGMRLLSTAISPPTLRLGSNVAGGATLAEATQASGVVTVAGDSGMGISVAFVGTTGGAADTNKVFYKKVTGAGPGTPVAVTLTAAEVRALGDGLVYVNAVQVDAANNAGVQASTSFAIDTTAPMPPVVLLGTGVAGGATRAEAMQASGIVTVAGDAGNRISVTFVGTTKGVADPSRVFSREVIGRGAGFPLPVVLAGADVTGLGDGLVQVNVVQVDNAGNGSGLSSTTLVIDTVRPLATTVTLIRPPTILGAVVRFTVAFSETVFVRGLPFVGLTLDGGVLRRAEYVSGSGTKTLVFQYRIQRGDRAAKGPAMASSISLGGGSIADSAGNAAVLAIRPPSLAGLVIRRTWAAAFAWI